MTENTEDVEEFVITRKFDATKQRVWDALTKAEQLSQWWGPKGFTIEVVELNVRPGGVFHYSMQTPDGQLMWGKFVYKEINEPDSMVFVNSFSDEKGGITRHPASPTWPLEVLNHLELTEEFGETRITLRGGPINASEEERRTFSEGHSSMQKGFSGTWDQLDAFLARKE